MMKHLVGRKRATKIQTAWRRHRAIRLARGLRRSANLRRAEAAVRIQSFLIRRIRRAVFRAFMTLVVHAITSIERVVRGFLARRASRRERAALAVQTTFRAYAARARVSALKWYILFAEDLRKRNAVTVLQRCVRRFLGRRSEKSIEGDIFIQDQGSTCIIPQGPGSRQTVQNNEGSRSEEIIRNETNIDGSRDSRGTACHGVSDDSADTLSPAPNNNDSTEKALQDIKTEGVQAIDLVFQ